MAILTMAILTMAILTMAILTMAAARHPALTRAPRGRAGLPPRLLCLGACLGGVLLAACYLPLATYFLQ